MDIGVKAEVLGFGGGAVELGREVEIITTANGIAGHTYEYWYKLNGDKGWTSCGKKITLPIVETCEKYTDTPDVAVQLCCRTYENGKNLGDSYKTDYLKFPSNIVPTASISNIKDGNTSTANAGQFLLGMSIYQADVSGTGIHGSTIKKIEVTCNGASVNVENGKINIPCNEQKLSVKLTITDSRGRTAVVTKEVTVYKYHSPTIWEYTVNRCDMHGNINESGLYCRCDFVSDCALYPGNKFNYKIEEQKDGDTGWRQCVKKTGMTTAGTTKEVFKIDPDYKHTVKLTLYDNVEEVFYTRLLLSTFSVMDIAANGNGIAFGRACDKDGFTCAMASDFTESSEFKKDLFTHTTKGKKQVGETLNNLEDKKMPRLTLKDGMAKTGAEAIGSFQFANEGTYRDINYILYAFESPTLSDAGTTLSNTKSVKPIFYFAWMQRNSGHESIMLPWTDGSRKTYIEKITNSGIYYKNPGSAVWQGYTLYVAIFYYL